MNGHLYVPWYLSKQGAIGDSSYLSIQSTSWERQLPSRILLNPESQFRYDDIFLCPYLTTLLQVEKLYTVKLSNFNEI
jgi:hypothetical protein